MKLSTQRFFKWLDDKLPDPPKPKTVEIGEALGRSSVYQKLESRLNRLEKAVDELKQRPRYPTSAPTLETHQ